MTVTGTNTGVMDLVTPEGRGGRTLGGGFTWVIDDSTRRIVTSR